MNIIFELEGIFNSINALKEEFTEDLEKLFGDNNSQMVDALYRVINDVVSAFNSIGWDE